MSAGNSGVSRRAPAIYVAVPSRDLTAARVGGRLALALAQFQAQDRYPVTIDLAVGQPVDVVRNAICSRFLASEADYLLMIDDDMIPPPDLLGMAEHGLDVVSSLLYAFLPSRGIYTVAYTSSDDGFRRLPFGPTVEGCGLVRVALVGGACLMIHRRVLEGLAQPWFHTVLNPDVTGLLDSEDFYFCRRAGEAGYEIWVDTDRPSGHIKSVDLRALAHWAQQYAQRRSLFDPLTRDRTKGMPL